MAPVQRGNLWSSTGPRERNTRSSVDTGDNFSESGPGITPLDAGKGADGSGSNGSHGETTKQVGDIDYLPEDVEGSPTANLRSSCTTGARDPDGMSSLGSKGAALKAITHSSA